MNCHQFQHVLHPYVDGELDPAGIADGDAHASVCPACARLAAGERRFRELMRRQPRESAPPELRARLLRIGRRERRRQVARRWALPAAAGIAAAFVAAIFLAPRGPTPRSLVADLVDTHMAFAQVEQPAEFSSAEPASVERWFRERAHLRVSVPDYSTAGIRLLGGRLAEAGERRAAYLLYQKGHILMSVFAVAAGAAPVPLAGTEAVHRGHPYRLQEQKGLRTVSWRDGPVVFSVISTLDYPALLECADRLRAQRDREQTL